MHKAIKILNEVDGFLSSQTLKKKSAYIASWHSKGTYPREIFPQLLLILEYYFNIGNSSNFSKDINAYPQLSILVNQFTNGVDTANPDDVLFFCSQSVVINNKKIYVAAILKKLFDCDLSNLDEHDIKTVLEFLARVLCRYDPSYIVHSPVLNKIYSEYSVGPGFNLVVFKNEYLPRLRKGEESDKNHDVLDKLNVFLGKFQNDINFTDDSIEELRAIYQYRWNKIKGTVLDYTRSQHLKKQNENEKKEDDKNYGWVVVAQILCGAKLISPGYYRFLMPSIQNDNVYSTGEPLEYYPLSHFILSENNDRLLSLDASVDYFDKNPNEGAFCNREVWPIKDFSVEEKKRIKFSADRFSKRHDLLTRDLSYFPIRRSTVNIVYELLMSSLRKTITEDELVFAYLQFCEKLGQLDSYERDRLYSQRIAWNGSNYSFFDLLSKIALGDVFEGCISIWSAYLLKFVIDYRPEVYLSTNIDCSRFQIMRDQSAKKAFRESEADIVKRNEMLMVSLLTYPFESRWLLSNPMISLLDCSNNCDNMLELFFRKFKAKIEANVKVDAYQEVMSTLVLPRLLHVEKSQLPDDVQSWLKQIRDESYFSKANLCVDPKTLFYVLSTFRLADNHPATLNSFLDHLIEMFTQKQNDSMLNIRVNVKLKHFLAQQTEACKKRLQEVIRYNHEPIQNQTFIKSLYEYLAHRQSITAPSAKSKVSFFSPACPPDLLGLNSVSDVLALISKEKVALDVGNQHEIRSSHRKG